METSVDEQKRSLGVDSVVERRRPEITQLHKTMQNFPWLWMYSIGGGRNRSVALPHEGQLTLVPKSGPVEAY